MWVAPRDARQANKFATWLCCSQTEEKYWQAHNKTVVDAVPNEVSIYLKATVCRNAAFWADLTPPTVSESNTAVVNTDPRSVAIKKTHDVVTILCRKLVC